jgi:mRNA interferase MazF
MIETQHARAGDVYLADLNPARGSEQYGTRPVLVISSDLMHHSKRMIVCPITKNMDFWTTKVPLPDNAKTKGMVLTDQVRSIDKNERTLRFIETLDSDFVALVRIYVGRLLELEFRQV